MMVMAMTVEKNTSTERTKRDSKSTWLATVEACSGMKGRLERNLGMPGLSSRGVHAIAAEHHQHEGAQREHGGDRPDAHDVHDDGTVFPARRIVVVAVERERVDDGANAF